MFRNRLLAIFLVHIVQQEQKLSVAHQVAPPVDGVQSKALRDKLSALETEIERFRRENVSLAQLRKEREEVRGSL